MILKNVAIENGTETVQATLASLAGTSTAVIPVGAVIHRVWYEPAVAGDDGGVTITIDGSGTDITIGTMSEADVSQTAEHIVFDDGWVVGTGQAGVLKAVATGSPTAGSGVLYALYTRAAKV